VADASPSTVGATEPTACLTTPADANRTVTIDVDDDSDGFGAFGTKVPSGLAAGPVRLVVSTADDNPAPVDVRIDVASSTAFEFVAVGAGLECGADVELVAGTYTVHFGERQKTFAVA